MANRLDPTAIRARWQIVAFLAGLCWSASSWAAPRPVSPGAQAGAALVEARCPTFSWAGVATARGYQLVVLRLSPDGSREPELAWRVELPADSRSFTPPVERCLDRGGRYAWSVAATSAAGEELEWSAALTFEIEALPATQVETVDQAIAVLLQFLEQQERAGQEDALGSAAAAFARVSPAVVGTGRTSDEPAAPGRESRDAADRFAAADAVVRSAAAATPPLGAASLSASGQIHLANASAVFKADVPFLWDDDATGNTALGREALSSVTNGTGNTAVGRDALRATTGGASFAGSLNTALGDEALLSNTTGKRNTATGADALRLNVDGFGNTATGAQALQNNTTGYQNVAVGSYALRANESGRFNTAVGVYALRAATSGSRNVAIGTQALSDETTGFANTAIGFEAMAEGAGHHGSTAVGTYALKASTGDLNTAIGLFALADTTSGSDNVALGYGAGRFNTTGSNNVFIANLGLSPEIGVDSNTIRIGNFTHDRFFVGGVRGKTTDFGDGIPVLIDSKGQLGTTSSSRRTKLDIRDATGFVELVLALRPVAFRYRGLAARDPEGPLQFGLIAEEVAEVLPDLVVFDAEGRPETVKYHLLSALLLAALQRQQAEIGELRERLDGSGSPDAKSRTGAGPRRAERCSLRPPSSSRTGSAAGRCPTTPASGTTAASRSGSNGPLPG